jgi:hypothetical protein
MSLNPIRDRCCMRVLAHTISAARRSLSNQPLVVVCSCLWHPMPLLNFSASRRRQLAIEVFGCGPLSFGIQASPLRWKRRIFTHIPQLPPPSLLHVPLFGAGAGAGGASLMFMRCLGGAS